MPRLISLIIALIGAIVCSQAPEFQQQYRQRLGGAIDELSREIARFDADAAAVGVTPEAAIARLQTNADDLARRRASAEIDAIARRDKLMRQVQVFETGNIIGRLTALVTDYDAALAAGTWRSFRPAVPTTLDGAAAALFGAGIGLFLVIVATLTSRGIGHVARGRHTAYKR